MRHSRADYNGRVVDLCEPLILAFMERTFVLATAIIEGVDIGLEDNAREVLADMQTIMAFHEGQDFGAIKPIPEEEPVFLVRGQDVVAGRTVRAWATHNNVNGGDISLSESAKVHADIMDSWPVKKLADIKSPEGQTDGQA